jgi:lactoylglutathione lyase
MKLNLLVIRCKDIESSKEFYENIGLKFVREKHGNGVEHYSSHIGDLVFELYPLKPNETPCNTRLGFSVKHVEELISHIEPYSQYEFNRKIIYILLDPDGRKIEIQER